MIVGDFLVVTEVGEVAVGVEMVEIGSWRLTLSSIAHCRTSVKVTRLELWMGIVVLVVTMMGG